MALLRCDFFSEVLGMGVSATVVLPQRTSGQIGVASGGGDGPPPVLYLLHGLSDDHTAWTRYTSVERYANDAGLAVVMPAVADSWYVNEVHGHRYLDFVADELPQVVRSLVRVSDAPADTFVAGLSMGGYGAVKLALRHPERYAAAASLSGALDVARVPERWPELRPLFDRVFGGGVTPADDLFSGLEQAYAPLPPLYLACGTEDPDVEATRRFHAAAVGAGADVVLDLRPGDHEWGLWDAVIRDVVAWLPMRGRPSGPRPVAVT
ncbi:alpha/beta hydrolase family protein [Nocardioides sp.]|uniref:alpha/beta hydrolase n=1 Tax=Nocardioides sp. TaxID=35761 RepID=UPI00272465BC|nr:alpha/beta hydrolase-fold protein [Nocardioides sp.]MDO9457698.1 alpha/beta hydrolase-fold protein [Nocardioides sp.]